MSDWETPSPRDNLSPHQSPRQSPKQSPRRGDDTAAPTTDVTSSTSQADTTKEQSLIQDIRSVESAPGEGTQASSSVAVAQSAAPVQTKEPPSAAAPQSPRGHTTAASSASPTAATVSPVGAAASPMLSPRGTSGGRLEGNCVQCGEEMGRLLGSMSSDGPLHNECIVKYRLTHVERCAHCDRRLEGQRMSIAGSKLHPDCVAPYKAKTPFAKHSKSGLLKKFSIGRSSGGLFGGSKNWKERYFVLDPSACTLSFYETEASMKQGKAANGVIVLDKKSTRLITRPMRKHHPEASNVSREFVIVFRDKGAEQRLLCQTPTWEEHEAWCDVLHDYICTVDAFEDGVEIVR